MERLKEDIRKTQKHIEATLNILERAGQEAPRKESSSLGWTGIHRVQGILEEVAAILYRIQARLTPRTTEADHYTDDMFNMRAVFYEESRQWAKDRI